MSEQFQRELQELGLTPAEAQIYVALVRNGALGASAIASVTGIARSSIYPMLSSLVEKGLLETGTGYGSRFIVVRPQQALAALIVHEKEDSARQQRLAAERLARRENLARDLAERLASIAEPAESRADELIQVIRSPRGVAERFVRLQLEAERQVEAFVKAPLFISSGNPEQAKGQQRGLRYRSVYERAVLDRPGVKEYLAQWVAQGEEARIYNGELPHKLAIFDRERVLVHLRMPGDQMRTLYIRHPELAGSLGIAFDALWALSEPVTIPDEKRSSSDTTGIRIHKRSGNGEASRPRK